MYTLTIFMNVKVVSEYNFKYIFTKIRYFIFDSIWISFPLYWHQMVQVKLKYH